MNTVIVPFGGLLGAMFGGVLWAKYIQWTGHTAGFIAIGIGALTGVGMLLTSARGLPQDTKTAWRIVGIGAAVFAIFGIFIGKYLDVQWNAVAQIAEQLRQENNISLEQAMPIATTLFKGQSVWELMQTRMSRIDLLYGAVAAFVAFRIPNIQRLRNLFY
ncbi:hypothetical protein F4Z99_15335 [Candidatus Poribacteria bacterium]|nr:hypothetical protein [Candidatus Poribacteria bacterium]MYA98965.1 hypothetical protein [Candidatus Poribacteria bacterium]